jgi:hypothetical protein
LASSHRPEGTLRVRIGPLFRTLIASAVHVTHNQPKTPIVVSQLAEHVLRTDEFRVVIANTPHSRDVSDGAKRRTADLTHPLGDRIRDRNDLIGLLIEQEVVVAEMRSAHVPVEVFRLQGQSEHVRQQAIECPTYFAGASSDRSLSALGRFG